MIIIPDSKLRFFKDIPLTVDDPNTILFNTKEQQINYFLVEKESISLDNYKFVRENQTLNIDLPYEESYLFNYMMYKNTAYVDKWFFAFVTKVDYVTNTTTRITFQLDEWQSYLFEKEIQPCFVEREHVADDTIGSHTVPESFELGEFQVVNTVNDFNGIGTCIWINPGVVDPFSEKKINNLFSPLQGIAYDSNSFGAVEDQLSLYREMPEKVVMITTITDRMVSPNTIAPVETEEEKTISMIKNFDGYTPKNNKLFTNPFTYLVVDNFNGQNNVLYWENFRDKDTASFTIYGAPYPKPSMMITPKNYKNQFQDTSESVYYDNFPLIPWQSNAFEQWVADGGLFKMGIDTSMQIGATALKPDSNSFMSLVGSVTSSIAEVKARKKHGNTFEGSIGTAAINMGMNYVGFRIRQYAIKGEYAKIIDNYFSRFGYQVNSYKKPELNSTNTVNYVKTIGAMVTGNLPQEVKKKMETDLNRGMSFWHNPNRIGYI